MLPAGTFISIPSGYTPQAVAAGYGIPQLQAQRFPGQLPGTGQTIGIFEIGYDRFFSDRRDPNYGNSDLAIFEQALGVPDPPSLSIVGYNPATGAVLTGASRSLNGTQATIKNGGNGEYAIDVEYAHAMAPGAAIFVLELDVSAAATIPQATAFIAQGMQLRASFPGCRSSRAATGSPSSPVKTPWTATFRLRAKLSIR